MNKRTKNIGSLLLILWVLVAFARPIKAQEQVYLFPDKSYAVSGDIVWFNLAIFNGNEEEMSGVVYVQPYNFENNHISEVSILCKDGIGTGFFPVPDLLSTGTYVLGVLSFIQKNDNNAIINQSRRFSVYNVFERKNPYTIQLMMNFTRVGVGKKILSLSKLLVKDILIPMLTYDFTF